VAYRNCLLFLVYRFYFCAASELLNNAIHAVIEN